MKKASENQGFTQEFFIFLALMLVEGLLPFVTLSTSANAGYVKLWVR